MRGKSRFNLTDGYDCEALLHQVKSEFASQNYQHCELQRFQFENSVFPIVFNGCCALLQRLKFKYPAVVYTMHDGHDLKHPLIPPWLFR